MRAVNLYVYGLVCPISNEIVYVGKATSSLESKLSSHIYSRKTSNRRKLCKWLCKMELLGLLREIKIVLIATATTHNELLKKERNYIASVIDNTLCVNTIVPKLKGIK